MDAEKTVRRVFFLPSVQNVSVLLNSWQYQSVLNLWQKTDSLYEIKHFIADDWCCVIVR